MSNDEQLSKNEISEDDDVFVMGRLFCDSCGKLFKPGDHMLTVDKVLNQVRESHRAMSMTPKAPIEELNPMGLEVKRVWLEEEIRRLTDELQRVNRLAPPRYIPDERDRKQ